MITYHWCKMFGTFIDEQRVLLVDVAVIDGVLQGELTITALQ